MAFVVDIKVVPQSGKQQWKLDKTDRLIGYIKSAPERNQANKELIKFLAKTLKIPMEAITITGGKTSRNKRIRIEKDIARDRFLQMLGVEKQMELF